MPAAVRPRMDEDTDTHDEEVGIALEPPGLDSWLFRAGPGN